MKTWLNSFLSRDLFKVLNPTFVLFLSVITLTFLGLVVLASASQTFSQDTSIFHKQVIWLGVAFIAGCITYSVPNTWIRKSSLWVFGAAMIFLVLVLVPGIGIKVNGSQRWLDLGPMRLQVSEFAKIGLVLVLADYLASNQRMLNDFARGFVIPSGIVVCFSLLIIIEPDFGTAFLCGVVGFSLLFLVGVRLKYLLPTLATGGLLFSIAILLNPTRLKRITSFLDVESNKSDGAYQLWQGILAFGAGGLEGSGVGNGRQQIAFLPEAHTDFILPVIGEELGLLGTGLVVFLFLAIFIVGIHTVRKAPSLYYYCITMGAFLFIAFQALINMGVVTGLLPTKGLSLPFISYGGSNLVVMFVFIGLVANCMRSWNRKELLVRRKI